MAQNNKKSSMGVPLAIIIAAVIIGGSVLLTSGNSSGENRSASRQNSGSHEQNNDLDRMRPVSESDHIRGNLGAAVTIVEYADPECPFCQRLHSTLIDVTEEYGDTVAWVYRHFPLDSIHPKARIESHAIECAGELGGNDSFWDYIDELYRITPANNGLDLALLPEIATTIGLDREAFESCQASGRYEEVIENDLQDGIATGVRGTPFSVIVLADGTKLPMSGAQPFSAIKSLIDTVIAN